MPDHRFLFAFCIFLQCKDHAGIPLKKAGTFLPAYPAFTMLQADKLLFHLSSAFWTHLIIFSHWQAPYKILFCKVQKLKSIILNKCSSQIYTLPANGPFCQSAAYRSCPRIHRQAPSPCHGIQYNLPL